MITQFLAQFVRGFTMGAADVVPGVSGGTVALVLGIYERLIGALHHAAKVAGLAIRGKFAAAGIAFRSFPWVWTLGLLAGILTAVLTLAGPLEDALHNYPEQMAGLFCGLIAAAVLLCWRQLKQSSVAKVLLAVVVAAGMFLVLGLQSGTQSVDAATIAPWVYFGSGAIAICAMILPGISGSFILVLLGMYEPVLSAVADRNFGPIIIFALGAATGIILAATGLNWLLEHYHDYVIAAMIGLMVGSFRILWPWPGGLDSTEIGMPESGGLWMPLLLGVAGFAVVLTVQWVADRQSARKAADEVSPTAWRHGR